jgi:hypothetical protein
VAAPHDAARRSGRDRGSDKDDLERRTRAVGGAMDRLVEAAGRLESLAPADDPGRTRLKARLAYVVTAVHDAEATLSVTGARRPPCALRETPAEARAASAPRAS